MSNKRKSRNIINEEEHDLLKPLDLSLLGTDDDPCFGKYHSLKAPECNMCGDSEFCAIVTAQNLHKKRLKEETAKGFKDIDEAERIQLDKVSKAKSLIKKYHEEGLKKLKIILKVCEETKLTKDKVKEIYKSI